MLVWDLRRRGALRGQYFFCLLERIVGQLLRYLVLVVLDGGAFAQTTSIEGFLLFPVDILNTLIQDRRRDGLLQSILFLLLVVC